MKQTITLSNGKIITRAVWRICTLDDGGMKVGKINYRYSVMLVYRPDGKTIWHLADEHIARRRKEHYESKRVLNMAQNQFAQARKWRAICQLAGYGETATASSVTPDIVARALRSQDTDLNARIQAARDNGDRQHQKHIAFAHHNSHNSQESK